LVAKKEEWIEQAFEKLAKLGVPQKEIRSKETCFLMISINGAKLSIDSLIYDWNRIYEVVCFDKVSKVSVNKLNLSLENTFKSFIALKYGLLVDEPDQLYNLGTLSSGRYSLRLTALEEPISGSSSDKESSHHSLRRQA